MSKSTTLHDLSRRPLETLEDFKLWFEEMEGASDRASALVAAVGVEHSLLELIETHLVKLSAEDRRQLFDQHSSPLGDFDSRIRIAHAFGLIDDACRQDLTTIRKVRNAFAHAILSISFEQPAVRTECSKLSDVLAVSKSMKASARERYIAAALGRASQLIDAARARTQNQLRSLSRKKKKIEREMERLQSAFTVVRDFAVSTGQLPSDFLSTLREAAQLHHGVTGGSSPKG